MRTRLLTAGLLLIALARPAGAAPAPFEGIVSMNLVHGAQTSAMSYAIKGTMLRMEMPAGGPHGGGAMIMDTRHDTMIMLMSEQHLYMEMAMPKPAAGARAKMARAKVTKTGKKETILGYPCEEWRIEGDQGLTTAWVAKGIGAFRGLGGPMARGPRPAWEAEMARSGAFPMRVVTRDASGGETGGMTVTAIEKKPLDATLFSPPADYKKFEMPAGAPGMGGGPGN